MVLVYKKIYDNSVANNSSPSCFLFCFLFAQLLFSWHQLYLNQKQECLPYSIQSLKTKLILFNFDKLSLSLVLIRKPINQDFQNKKLIIKEKLIS